MFHILFPNTVNVVHRRVNVLMKNKKPVSILHSSIDTGFLFFMRTLWWTTYKIYFETILGSLHVLLFLNDPPWHFRANISPFVLAIWTSFRVLRHAKLPDVTIRLSWASNHLIYLQADVQFLSLRNKTTGHITVLEQHGTYNGHWRYNVAFVNLSSQMERYVCL